MFLIKNRIICAVKITIPVFALGFFLAMCSNPVSNGIDLITPRVKLTSIISDGNSLGFHAAGDGIISIDWGDGRKEKKGLRSHTEYYYTGNNFLYEHDYGKSGPRTIAIDIREADITHLDFGYCSLTRLEVIGCGNLTELDCRRNNLNNLVISGCGALKRLVCYGNLLTDLDVSAFPELLFLNCSDNKLTDLDVCACTELESLSCGNNQLTYLGFPDSLYDLDCSANKLTGLDAGACASLLFLLCGNNKLANLDVSGCTELESLYAGGNELQNLDISNCEKLQDLAISYNEMSAGEMDAVFSALPDLGASGIEGNIWISGNPGTDGCNKSILAAKGWVMVNTGYPEYTSKYQREIPLMYSRHPGISLGFFIP